VTNGWRPWPPLGTDAEKPFLENAPWLIAIFEQRHGLDDSGQKKRHYYTKESVGLAAGFLIAALHNVGLASLTHTPSPMNFLNRILEAVAGDAAVQMARSERDQLGMLGSIFRSDAGSFADQTVAVVAERDALRKELAKLQQDSARSGLDDVLNSPRKVAGLKVVSTEVPAEDKNAFMQLGDHVRDKLQDNGVVVLASEIGGKATLLVTVTNDLSDAKKLHAGNLVKALAEAGGGRGGGRPNMAQAGMPSAEGLRQALAAVDETIAQQLG